GMKLVAARGRLMGALPQDGTMISLLTDEARVRQAVAPYQNTVSIAAVNGPESIVISGERTATQAVAAALAAEGVKTRELTVSHAFHSPLMEPMLNDFAQVAQSITYHEPRIPIVSNLTGQLSTDPLSTVPRSYSSRCRQFLRRGFRRRRTAEIGGDGGGIGATGINAATGTRGQVNGFGSRQAGIEAEWG
ncbi:MAG: acyltransferase domain-containing protein, partial [Caldilineaceae bacterium]|nr:acyltransferase domain-containing protein [Caldilineaceae bacterium]